MKRLGCFFMVFYLLCGNMVSVAASEVPAVESQYVYVLNLDEDRVLYEKAAHEKMYPASMTKMMTVLVALEHTQDLEEIVVFDKEMLDGLYEAGASVVGYKAGDQARIIDLLYGTLLPSGADAGRALAFHIAGSEESFVELMNEKAKQLQLENTHFVNTSGLHDDAHYSTASDMAMILKEGLKNKTFETIFTSDSYVIGSVIDTTATLVTDSIALQGTTIYSTKVMMLQRAGLQEDIIQGSKTGFTLEGGLCMASIAEHENAHYLLITGQAGDDVATAQHMKDAYAIYQYLFDTYERVLLYAKDEAIQTIDIRYGSEKTVEIKPSKDIYALVEKADPQVETQLHQSVMKAAISKDQNIGTMQVLYHGEERFSFDVFAAAEVNWSLGTFLSYFLFEKYLLIPLILVLFAFFIWKRKKKMHKHCKLKRFWKR